MTMTRINDNTIKHQLDLVVGGDRMTAETALRYLLDEYDFDVEELLKAGTMDKDINISFSKLKYSAIARAVGLEPRLCFSDAPSFALHRSRIPTSLLKEIVKDIDASSIHYGSLKPRPEGQNEYLTEEGRSRVLAPIFSRLVAQFGGAIQNVTESLMSGRITRDRVDYHFKTFSLTTVVFVEVELPSRCLDDHLNAIAQVIEEIDACNEHNCRTLWIRMPIYGILYDGNSFRFFHFDGSTTPYKFRRGIFSPSDVKIEEGLKLVDFSSKDTAHSFVLSLRPICETIFNIFLRTYITTLKVYRDFATNRPALRGWLVSPDPWVKALEFAEEAMRMSRDAEIQRQENAISAADLSAINASKALKLSIDAVPPYYKIQPLMDTWDFDELSRV